MPSHCLVPRARSPVRRPLSGAIFVFLLLASFTAPLSAAPRKAAHPSSASSPAAPRTAATECHSGAPSFFRDEAMTIKVATKLQFNRALLREKVNVKVTGGVAMLWGGLSGTEAIAAAVRLASEVEGIRCVDNQLKVGPPDQPAER
jgi:hypothetical protein